MGRRIPSESFATTETSRTSQPARMPLFYSSSFLWELNAYLGEVMRHSNVSCSQQKWPWLSCAFAATWGSWFGLRFFFASCFQTSFLRFFTSLIRQHKQKWNFYAFGMITVKHNENSVKAPGSRCGIRKQFYKNSASRPSFGPGEVPFFHVRNICASFDWWR